MRFREKKFKLFDPDCDGPWIHVSEDWRPECGDITIADMRRMARLAPFQSFPLGGGAAGAFVVIRWR